MDSDFKVDIGEVSKNIDSGDVVCFYFPLLRKTLILDARLDPVEGPMVKVVPMADSVEDRIKSIRRLRPRLPAPESLALVPWPKYLASLKRLGLWERVLRRFASLGYPEAVVACERAYEHLAELERGEVADALQGRRYQTIWQRRR